ncbi:replicative DNA helicase [Microvirga sesbaniae]|uniref:replicative DNA helicase n=1 Tax=Microvirga sesbaniae TaxID=681392 RepID=UPI0021C67689|nr:DnaB-like helicase C-terminal domain-containing protein [Microvirga sp. HBU67692]
MANILSFEPSRPADRHDRLPPVNTDVEMEVLAALLAAPAEIGRVQAVLKPDYFFEQIHQVTYAAILAIAEADGRPTAGQLYQRLGPAISATAVAADVTVRRYLAELARIGGMTGAPLLTHARVIRDLYLLRHVEAIGAEIGQRQGYDPCAFLDERFERLDELRALRMDRQLTTATLAAAGASLMGQIDADLTGQRRLPATTGLARLDKALGGGLRPATLTTLAARTSMGKSILGCEVALNAARQGLAGLYHSQEMDKDQVMARFASSWLERQGLQISFARMLAPGGLTVEEAGHVAQAVRELSGLSLTIEDGGGRTIREIAAASERLMNAYLRKGLRPGPIVIDHAHIVRPGRSYNREDEGLKEVADGALALAKRLDAPVLLLAQCNRNTESREDKRPSLADLRGAGAFEENSDAVVFLYRPAYYIERSARYRDGDIATQDDYEACKHSLEIIVDKNRAGRSNQVVRAWVDPALNAVRDLDSRSGRPA